MSDTTAPPVSIVEFLTARYNEEAAWAASGAEFQSWNRSWDSSPTRDIAVGGVRVGTVSTEYDEHIACHDPARVLADIAAKRRMLERAWLSVQYLPPEMRTSAKDAAAYHAFWVLEELASVYADHPDYRREWKP